MATPKQIEAEVTKMMTKLGLSKEEALELVLEDMEVDKMTVKEAQADLTPEQKKNAKEVTKTTKGKEVKKPTNYKFEKKARKTDDEKADFISKLFDFVKTLSTSAEVVNKEREIAFTIGENEYSLTLVKHRKKKS